MDPIYPAILPVPEDKKHLPPREKTKFLSEHARRAIAISAQKTGISLGKLDKDDQGRPVPFGGMYWSLTHKPDYVSGVIAPFQIGIDVERIKSCHPGLFGKIAGKEEWQLSEEKSDILFFRFWTAKEAVLKASGRGMKDLSKCRIIEIVDHLTVGIEYQQRRWIVEHLYFGDHIASVVKNDTSVIWSLEKSWGKASP
jgi:4'-phosphopantetheinyl transferase